MKTALYTVTYNGGFYRGAALTLEEIFLRAADIGYDGVEIGAKRPIASPMDLDSGRRRAVRRMSSRTGVEIGCVAGYSNLAGPVLEHREAELVWLRETIRLAHDLEAPVVRVFAAWPGVTLRDGQTTYELARSYRWHDVTSLEQWSWVRQCLVEAARWAENYGVVLALQNHGPVTDTYRDTLDMVHEIKSPWLKACVDAPHLEDQTDAGVRQALLETGDLEAWSHFGGFQETPSHHVYAQAGGRVVAVNYPAFFRALREIGYRGFVAYEGCSPTLVGHDYQGTEEVDRRATLALQYMRRQIERSNEPNAV